MSHLFRTPFRFNQQRNGIPKIPKRSFEGRFPTSSESLRAETSDTTKRYKMEERLPTSSDSSRGETSETTKRYRMDERFDLLNGRYAEKDQITDHYVSRHQQALYHEEEDLFSEDEDDMSHSKSIRIESPETLHTEETPKNRKRVNSSERNAWNPANLILNTCYNDSNGILLSKEQCKINLENALKMKKDIDFYDILQLGDSPEHRTMSFVLYTLNTLLRKSPKEDNPKIVPCSIFDEDAVKEVEDGCLLPGGVSLKISLLLFPGISVNWVGRRAVSKAIVRILDLIASRDKYFLIYSSPDSDRPTTYPTLSFQFFSSFSRVIQAGFRLPTNSSSLSTIIAHVRASTRTYIEKRRSKKKNEVDALFAKFQQLIEIDPQFRSKEDPIHNLRAIPNVVPVIRNDRSQPMSSSNKSEMPVSAPPTDRTSKPRLHSSVRPEMPVTSPCTTRNPRSGHTSSVKPDSVQQEMTDCDPSYGRNLRSGRRSKTTRHQ